ncbi:SDR family NAD(P)-dependent oxidoreductase [Brevibacillus laterosporus]|uniref:SDR family NAD(P)-dependent oxidoreductase n=1 Tax=Brevibacillus laterosporus TaxID=1465 RepID=UPI00215C1894|nr:SDR family NAD(P)-dependent oxidoreductase [Brevibacillus laterosporus]MCR8993891.1 SDR family NAD(P)-dependent oxidoreductase [Brevibacillus laterosporus]
MNFQEILRALQAGVINSEDAKKMITGVAKTTDSRHHSAYLDEKAHGPNEKVATNEQHLHKEVVMTKSHGLVLSTVHSLDELSLQAWDVPEPEKGEVTVQVKASAINFPDTMCVKGLYPTMPDYPFVPGFEVAGIVTKVAQDVTEFQVGDEIIALTGKQLGGHATYVNVSVANAVRKPRSISFEEACSLPVVFSTVYHAFETGQLGSKEHVLIQTATGGCGLVALQLANLKGCVCYGTSSKSEKLEILKRIGVSHAINYRTTEFDQEIKKITNGNGIDVVLNMLSGESIQKGLDCLGPSGRYVELAVHALKTSKKLDLSRLVQNQTIYSVDLRRLSAAKGFNKELLNTMVTLLEAEKIVPIVSRVYPLRQIAEALEYVGEGKHIGKVVISHTAEDMMDYSDLLIRRLQLQKEKSEDSLFIQQEKAVVNLQSIKAQQHEGIAVIGMSGQFPKSKDINEFWNNLAQGKDCVTEIPPERWSIEEYYDPDVNSPGKTYCKWMGALDDVDKFDPLFFHISPVEAEYMDPQQRLFLENSWKCIEDAGLSPVALSGSRCGVFVGCGTTDYGRSQGQQEMNAQSLMGASVSILSSRISYLLNLKGPCLAIDTACSSSLVAIAEACNSLALGNCDLALAGGVSVMTGPSMHIMTSKAGMLSKDGRCFTFDNRANGFVPGEGVGVVLVKRLSDAIRDNDPIYGVIRGWGINQDGKTNGITAPSVNSQVKLEKEVYERYGIHPENISLIEAHGTGTKLGDPIEMEALTEAFRAYTNKQHYCAVGSVKSNIGHLMAASGVSGVIKVLLALQHRMLPPTIHFESLNEHISLERSPFYMNTKLQPWSTPNDIPRLACVSSFGFSGTNAHLVIEEYVAKTPRPNVSVTANKDKLLLFPWSAKNGEQLHEQVKLMKSFVERSENISLEDVAYTLQVGRAPMDFRLAIVANSKATLITAMEAFLNGRTSASISKGQVMKGKEGLTIFEEDEEAAALLTGWLQKGKLKKIADVWVKGLTIDWDQLNRKAGRRRIHLPTYPFARESYWLHEKKQEKEFPSQAVIHPLLQQNTSQFAEQRFSSTFTGEEFFLKDHVVSGQKVLPGVAYLEMVREAVEQSIGDVVQSVTQISFADVVWANPIRVGDVPFKVHVSLVPEENNTIKYFVFSNPVTELDRVIHGQGKVILHPYKEGSAMNITKLQAECSLQTLSSKQCYDSFDQLGIRYGSSFRGVEKIYMGQGKLLAKLCQPSSVTKGVHPFVLHPSLMDSALQATIGFALRREEEDAIRKGTDMRTYLPFALQSLEIYGECTSNMWAFIRKSDQDVTDDSLQKYDVDLYDEEGNSKVKISGFTTKAVGSSSKLNLTPTSETGNVLNGKIKLTPVWDRVVLEGQKRYTDDSKSVLIVGGSLEDKNRMKQLYQDACLLDFSSSMTIDEIAKQLEVHESIEHFIWMAPHGKRHPVTNHALIEEQELGVLQVFKIMKALLRLGYGNKEMQWSVITIQAQTIRKQDAIDSTHSGLHGLIGSMAKEYPNWKVRLIDLEADKAWPIEDIRHVPTDSNGNALGYRAGQWYHQRLIPCEITSTGSSSYRNGGVYVVIGGAGGIGEVWSEYMIQTYQAQIVWIGRRGIDASIQARIDRLASFGPAPIYISADATDQDSLQQAYESIKSQYQRIHGVIHSAIVLLDQSIANMDEARFRSGLAAKVDVSVRMAQVFQKEPLDFVLFFSSFNSFLTSPGQSNYTSGCTFTDAFAHQLAREWPCAVKVINWGYWGSVGTVATQKHRERMARVGMGSIEPQEAMEALEALLGGSVDQLAFIKTTKPLKMSGMRADESIFSVPARAGSIMERVKSRFTQSQSNSPFISTEDILVTGEADAKLLQLNRQFLSTTVSNILKVDTTEIDMDAEMTEYGLDLLKLSQLADAINHEYKLDLTPGCLLEHVTLTQLADFLTRNLQKFVH